MPVATYLKEVRKQAKLEGYPKPTLASDGVHKIEVVDEDGKVHKAGRVGYGDVHIWRWMESKGIAPPGTAAQKQDVFRKSHLAIKGNWRKNPYSPNWLAIRLLW